MKIIAGSKLVVWGVGEFTDRLIPNLERFGEVIALVDRNPEKWGLRYGELYVSNPCFIRALNFDKVVVATQFVEQVCENLKTEFSITDAQILIPPKTIIKGTPFQNPICKALATKALLDIVKESNSDGLDISLDFGTLLGVIRENALIDWDDDIDLTVDHSLKDKLEEFLITYSCCPNLPNTQVCLTRIKAAGWGVIAYNLRYLHAHGEYFDINIGIRNFINGRSVYLPSFGFWSVPEEHFKTLCTTKFMGQDVSIPKNSAGYLCLVYGANWRVPCPEFTFNSYANCRVEYEKRPLNPVVNYEKLYG